MPGCDAGAAASSSGLVMSGGLTSSTLLLIYRASDTDHFLALLLSPHDPLRFTRLMGSTTFEANRAYKGGAIYNSDEEAGRPAAITTFPADTIFVDNYADVRITTASLVPVVHVHASKPTARRVGLLCWC